LRGGTFNVNHSTDFEKRWGGWYVTGDLGEQKHMGNGLAFEKDRQILMEPDRPHNLKNLDKIINTEAYLEKGSDVVALMVLEHQTHMQNIITQASFDTRIALERQKGINETLERPEGTISENTVRHIHSRGDKIIEYLLFCDEADFSSEITGSSSFKTDFEKIGPFDKKKRSLREFDLKESIFKYPLSYQIYSKPFDAMPEILKEYVYKELWLILSDQKDDVDEKFLQISRAKGKKIITILLETKKGLPSYWKEVKNK
jgi:hypothetical protein